MDYVAQLKELPKRHDYFIGFDSDGCVFDTLEIRQKECFCPAVIRHMGVQAVSKAAREVWEFVNLYSKTRGGNRFLALERFLKLLRERCESVERGLVVPEFELLEQGFSKFFAGTFAGEYQQMLLDEFDAALPKEPLWN